MSTERVAEVVLVYGEEEWGGAYVDGVLALQNHTVDLGQIIYHGIGSKAVRFTRRLTVRGDWLDLQAELPAKLGDIPTDAIVSDEATPTLP